VVKGYVGIISWKRLYPGNPSAVAFNEVEYLCSLDRNPVDSWITPMDLRVHVKGVNVV
jgi:hypothetical protein